MEDLVRSDVRADRRAKDKISHRPAHPVAIGLQLLAVARPAASIDKLPHKNFLITRTPPSPPYLCGFLGTSTTKRNRLFFRSQVVIFDRIGPSGEAANQSGVATVQIQSRGHRQNACRRCEPFAPPHHKGVAQAFQIQGGYQARVERPRQGYVILSVKDLITSSTSQSG